MKFPYYMIQSHNKRQSLFNDFMANQLSSAIDKNLRYTRLFETARDGILILTYPEGKIIDANPFILDLLGYSRSDLLGKELWEIGLLADKKKALLANKEILQHGFVRYEDIDLVSKKGKLLPTEFICNSYDEGNNVVIQCNIRDISARKNTENVIEHERRKNISQLKDAISSLSNAIELRDPFTAGHQKRVTNLVDAIARELKLSEHDIEGLSLASIIHDIGKINVPVEILTKPYTLSEVEISLLRGHVHTGFLILKPLVFPWPIAEYVLQHHERLDGSGYPNSLKGDAISLGAKIMGVADTVEAMSSHRPYRHALGIETALATINANRNILFDADVVDVCTALFKKKNYQFPQFSGPTLFI